MYDVFLSYAREDRERAKAFAAALETCGVSVWWDSKIRPGKSWDTAIEETLGQVRAAIVLWSRNSVKARWVKEEAERALQREILIPVQIDDVELPLGFSRLQTADLQDWSGTLDHPELAGVLESLSDLLSRPVLAPTSEERPAQPAVAAPPPPAAPAKPKASPAQDEARPRDKPRPPQWHAQLVDRGLNRYVVRIELTHDVHQVELVHHVTKPVNAESVLVDGVVVAQGGTAVSWCKSFDFVLKDGPDSLAAKVDLEPNIWLGTLKKFRLTVAGRVLYQDGDW